MADDFGSFSRRVERFADDVAGKALRKTLEEVGKGGKADAAKAVQMEGSRKGSLADQSMRNWRPGNPIQITARYDIRGDTEVEVLPERKNRGPWRVLEEGRRAGARGEVVEVGRKRKDGSRRTKARTRGQGATAAKNTWSDAVELMDRNTPKRIDDAVRQSIRRNFGG